MKKEKVWIMLFVKKQTGSENEGFRIGGVISDSTR